MRETEWIHTEWQTISFCHVNQSSKFLIRTVIFYGRFTCCVRTTTTSSMCARHVLLASFWNLHSLDDSLRVLCSAILHIRQIFYGKYLNNSANDYAIMRFSRLSYSSIFVNAVLHYGRFAASVNIQNTGMPYLPNFAASLIWIYFFL